MNGEISFDCTSTHIRILRLVTVDLPHSHLDTLHVSSETVGRNTKWVFSTLYMRTSSKSRQRSQEYKHFRVPD